MKKTNTILLFALAITLSGVISALPALAQENALDVKCADSSGNAVAGVEVQLLRMQISPAEQKAKEKKSDKAGMALFTKLDPGYYRVVGYKDSFAPALYEFVQIGGTKQAVKLNMEPGDRTKKLYFEDQAAMAQSDSLAKIGVDAITAQKLQDAEKAFREAIALNPSDPNLNFNLSVALIYQRKFREAAEPLQKTSSLAAIGIEMMKGQPGEAPMQALKKNADTTLAKIPGLLLREDGQKALSEKNFDLAHAKFSEALKAEPTDPDLMYNVALSLANQSKFDEASTYADQALKVNPNEKDYIDLKLKIVVLKAQYIREQGKELEKAGDHEGALKKFNEALALAPDQYKASYLQYVGIAQAGLGHYDLAAEAYKKALELDPQNARTWRALIFRNYLKQKRYDEALDYQLDPSTAATQSLDQRLFDLGKRLRTQDAERSGPRLTRYPSERLNERSR